MSDRCAIVNEDCGILPECRQASLRLRRGIRGQLLPLVRVALETPDFQAYRGDEPPRFVNEAEFEYAEVLDYTAPVAVRAAHLRARAGRRRKVVEAFTPDFYLPEQDLYLEVTVMKQSLVTRKNRKLRKLRSCTPRCGQALLQARLRADRGPLRPPQALASTATRLETPRIGDVYLGGAEIAARVRELGAEIARDYAGREPCSSARSRPACRSSPTSRARSRSHALDFVELAGYGSARWAGTSRSASSRTST